MTATAAVAENGQHTPEVAARVGTGLLAGRVDLREMIRTKPDPIDMVLQGLPLGSVGVVLGTGGIGKSMMMLSVAYAVGTGTDPLACLLPRERMTKGGRVVYLTGEDDVQIIHYRVNSFMRDVPEEAAEMMDAMIDIVPLVGTAPTLIDANGNENDTALAAIRAAASGARLLIIDPLRQFHAGDENDNGHMTTLSKALTRIAHEERCSTIVVHHTSKAGEKDGSSDAWISRGAAAITDNARWVMALQKLSENTVEQFGLALPSWRYVSVRRVKANYAELGDATVLVRGEGGVLAPASVQGRDMLRHAITAVDGDTQKLKITRCSSLPRTASDLLATIEDDDAA